MSSRIGDSLTLIAHGMMAGSAATAAAFTSVKGARFARFKAKGDNAGNVYIGLAGVTVGGTTTSATAGWELDAGQEHELQVPGGDLANLFRICENAGDDCFYECFG